MILPGVLQSMENDKRSLFSSLFGRGKKQNKEAAEAAALEARQKLEQRIQEVLAAAAEAPKPLFEESQAGLTLTEEPVTVAEVLPITASALNRRKAAISVDLWPGNVQVERPYAVNEWR